MLFNVQYYNIPIYNKEKPQTLINVVLSKKKNIYIQIYFAVRICCWCCWIRFFYSFIYSLTFTLTAHILAHIHVFVIRILQVYVIHM